MRSSAFCLLPSAFCLLLAACVSAPPPMAAPAGHVVGPDEAQAILYDATATARAASTQSVQATATRIRENELLADDLTRTAAEAQSVATMAAATPTAFSRMATATAYEFNRQATQDAYAVNAVATQAATVRREVGATRWGVIWVIVALVLTFAALVFAIYLHNLGRVHIASLAFRALGGGVVAEWTPSAGWQTWQTPAALPKPTELALTPETRAERARKDWHAKNDADWARFYRRLVMWAQSARSWSNAKLCDELDVLSDAAWRAATDELARAGCLIRQGGRNRRETVWHPDWSFERFQEKGMAALLPHPTSEPPDIKIPLHHNTTTPQPATSPQQEIILYAEEQ
jgi:hypothetical protein